MYSSHIMHDENLHHFSQILFPQIVLTVVNVVIDVNLQGTDTGEGSKPRTNKAQYCHVYSYGIRCSDRNLQWQKCSETGPHSFKDQQRLARGASH